MSRVITVERCFMCPYNDENQVTGAQRCTILRRRVPNDLGGEPFPAWCPLPESKEESDERVR